MPKLDFILPGAQPPRLWWLMQKMEWSTKILGPEGSSGLATSHMVKTQGGGLLAAFLHLARATWGCLESIKVVLSFSSTWKPQEERPDNVEF